MTSLLRIICRILILCMLSATWIPARATLLGAEATLPSTSAASGRTRLQTLLSRADVQQQLSRMGISSRVAQARVNAMTDDEVRQVAGRLDSLPAGGDVFSVVIAVALILLITDLLGFTHVYPFVHHR